MSLKCAPPVEHGQDGGHECSGYGSPKPRSPGSHPVALYLLLIFLLLLLEVRGDAGPGIACQEVGTGFLHHMDPKSAHRHILVLLRAVAGPRGQGAAPADVQVC